MTLRTKNRRAAAFAETLFGALEFNGQSALHNGSA
jgi:hypothetical protein